MASERSWRRWLPTLAILTAVALPAVAVTTISASAHSKSQNLSAPAGASAHHDVDDMDLTQEALRAARTHPQRASRPVVAAPLTASQIQRVSRNLVRQALTTETYVRPVPGPVTQWYGSHPGIDIAPPFGTPIGAAHSGVVTYVGWDDGYGMHVEVTQLDGFVTTYSHMSAWTVHVGQLVVAGQQLGNVGSTGDSTGPHLHFEVHLPGGARMDPAIWLYLHGAGGG